MPIRIRREIDFKSLEKEILEKAEKALDAAVADEIEVMIERTRSGKGPEGQVFRAYTPEYKRYKAKRGRNTGTPDLTFSGNMLANITHKISRTSRGIKATVFFSSVKEAQKALGNIRTRPFFGFAKEQIDRITQEIGNAINE